MASRRENFEPSTSNNAPTDPKSSKRGSTANKANNSGTGKKPFKSSGTIVKSRYLQAAEKTSLSKSNSQNNESIAGPFRPCSPKSTGTKAKVVASPRRSLAPQALAKSIMLSEPDPTLLGKSVLQSTFSDGHGFRPDFDISAIKDEMVTENAAEPRNPEVEKEMVEMQTFLLTYLTAKMEHNTAKLKTEAEMRLLQLLEEEEMLHNEVKEKKRHYLLAERKRLLNERLDLQIEILTPLSEAAGQFTKDYKNFAAAVDTTRHDLPVKNFYIDGDGKEFLDKAESCLKETEKLLLECTQGDHEDNSTSLECLRDMKITSKAISQQLSGTCSELQELSSLVCRRSVYNQQVLEEEKLGSSRTSELFCPKQECH